MLRLRDRYSSDLFRASPAHVLNPLISPIVKVQKTINLNGWNSVSLSGIFQQILDFRAPALALVEVETEDVM